MEREDLFREYLRYREVSSNSINSYVHYLNRLSEISGVPINFNTLNDESCVNRIINLQRRTGKNIGSIANYKSAMKMYVDMVNHIQGYIQKAQEKKEREKREYDRREEQRLREERERLEFEKQQRLEREQARLDYQEQLRLDREQEQLDYEEQKRLEIEQARLDYQEQLRLDSEQDRLRLEEQKRLEMGQARLDYQEQLRLDSEQDRLRLEEPHYNLSNKKNTKGLHGNTNKHTIKPKGGQQILIAKGFLLLTAGIMDAYSRLLCALIFWDSQFLNGEWMAKRIWNHKKSSR